MQICTTLGFGFGLRPSPLNMGEHLKCDYDQILPADIDNAKLFAFFLSVFMYCGCKQVQRFHNVITRPRWIVLPDYDIDPILKPSV